MLTIERIWKSRPKARIITTSSCPPLWLLLLQVFMTLFNRSPGINELSIKCYEVYITHQEKSKTHTPVRSRESEKADGQPNDD